MPKGAPWWLASGKLTSTGFVRVAANSGALQVMRTSLCWDRPGPVDPDRLLYHELKPGAFAATSGKMRRV